MDNTMLGSVLHIGLVIGYVLLGVFLVSTVIDKYFEYRLNPKEPPLLPQKLPLIGHLLGFLRYGSEYYLKMSNTSHLPIATIKMPNGRTYCVNDVRLVQAVQRNAKTISFDPILTTVAERLAGIGGDSLQVLREMENGGAGAHRKLVHAMSPSLTGRGLDLMNVPTLKVLENYINELAEKPEKFDLWKWTRHVISIASTEGVYGPENPYRIENFKYEDTFWKYESRITMLLVNFFPKITASEPYKQREWLAECMIDYYRRGAWKRGSLMVQSRCQAGLDNNVPIEAIARLEVPGGTGILSNTVPTAFWTLVNVCSNPKLLAEIRAEVDPIFRLDENSDQKDTWLLDTADIRTKCPLLFSIYQETLRTRASFASPRYVLEDTMLEDRYLLKKGALLQIPSSCLHHDASQWGKEPSEFEPYRFMPHMVKASPIKRSPVAFRAFGGAPALCPGRHFATVEVLCFVAMMVAKYDVESAAENGAWKLPPPNYGNIAASILPPLGDIRVQVKLRNGFEDRKFGFRVTTLSSEEQSLFTLASEGAGNEDDSLTRVGYGKWSKSSGIATS